MNGGSRPEAAGLADRLRRRRLAVGLSQGELAGSELSPSYVSLLEAGKRTPTVEVLAVLAERLECSVLYLLEGVDPAQHERARLTVEYADLAIRNGEAADALSELDALLSSTASLDGQLKWRARRLHARALESVGRLEPALEELETLRADALKAARYTDELQLTVDLVRCYQEVGDVTLAVETGERTLERLDSMQLGGTDEHARLVSAVIGAYYERGDLIRAAMLARTAVTAIDAMGSRQARAAVYWNASLTTEATGDTAGAVVLAERAVALLAELDETRSLGRLRTAFGWLYLRLDPPDPDRAFDQLRAARQALLDVGSQVDLAYCETELGRCALLKGDPEDALSHTTTARSHLGDAPRVELAHAVLVEGRALLAAGRSVEALDAYQSASTLMSKLGLGRQAAPAWRELGDVYEEMGRPADAAEAYREALTHLGVRAAPRPARRTDTRTETTSGGATAAS